MMLHFLCFDSLQITLFFFPWPLLNRHRDCDRRSYKAPSCLINVNPHHIQRLRGSSIIHARRRWTDWIVTTQAGTDEQSERGMSCLLSIWASGSGKDCAEKWGGKMLIRVWNMFGQQGDSSRRVSKYSACLILQTSLSVMLLALTFDLSVEERCMKRE